MKHTSTNLGAMLRRYRVNQELDLRSLASEIGVSAATLMRIEHGYGIEGGTLLALMNWMLKPNSRNGKDRN